MPRLDRGLFRSWLATRPPSGSVGLAWRPEACPLARYLGQGWEVDGRVARCRRHGFRRPLPMWAVLFAYAVDDLTGYLDRPRRVYPRVALEPARCRGGWAGG